MTQQQWMERLHLSRETQQALEALELPQDRAAQWEAAAAQGAEPLHRAIGQQDQQELLALKLYLALAEKTREGYLARGIPEDVFWDSMEDFSLWSEDYRRKTGRAGVDQWQWLSLVTGMQVIRLGRLQFQPISLPEEGLLEGHHIPAGTQVLAVHVPAGPPLAPEAVRQSLCQAPAFFRTYFGAEYRYYRCQSWLLSPVLQKMLPESSGILQFQRWFQVSKTLPSQQAVERVFGDPGRCRESTLQRAMAQHLKAGGAVPEGIGLGRFPETPQR